MDRLTVLVVRETRLEELKARFNTVSQARFYVESLGGDFADYEAEDRVYRAVVHEAQQTLTRIGRVQVVPRAFVPNFIFGASDVVVAVGQDGLVANILKYLGGQPLIGINPEPRRYDGQLLPFSVGDLGALLPEVFRRKRSIKEVTMARATLNNGQTLHAVNDLFVGPKSHGSARYTLRKDGRTERQSSSGVIVSTGLGSTGWFSSLVAGARGLGWALAGDQREVTVRHEVSFPWDAAHLLFTVREPFPSQTTGVEIVFGRVSANAPLILESHMAERGVIFSDGIESDFVEFNSGVKVEISVAEKKGLLVV